MISHVNFIAKESKDFNERTKTKLTLGHGQWILLQLIFIENCSTWNLTIEKSHTRLSAEISIIQVLPYNRCIENKKDFNGQEINVFMNDVNHIILVMIPWLRHFHCRKWNEVPPLGMLIMIWHKKFLFS